MEGDDMLQKFIAKLKANGMTQQEIAERTGLKQSFVSQLANGKKPSIDTVMSFAKAFNASLDEVCDYTPDHLRNANTNRDNYNNKNL